MSILLRQTEVNIRERGGGRKRKPDWLVEEHGLEDGTKTPARIHLRLPSAILARLGGPRVGRICGLQIFRLGSNRGIKALQFF